MPITIKKICVILFCCIMLLSLCPTIVNATTLNGYCGENVQWEFHSESGELIISGNGDITTEPGKAFGAKVTSLVIEEGITGISASAFSNLENIQELYLPESVAYIAGYAFFGCKNLSKVTVTNPNCEFAKTSSVFDEGTVLFGYPDSTTQRYAGSYKFPFIEHIYSDNTCLICQKALEPLQETWEQSAWSLDIHTGHLKICMQANGEGILFSDGWEDYGKLVKLVTIEGDLKWISGGSFSDFRMLEQVEITSASNLTIFDEAFKNCSNLRSISITGAVERIGKQAFYQCYSLREIVLPEGLTKIEESAFAFSGLIAIKIPNSVTYLGEYCFRQCESLQAVILGNQIEDITDAFAGSVNIEILQCAGILPTGIGDFSEMKNCSLYYPINEASWTTNTEYKDNFKSCYGYDPQDLEAVPISDEEIREMIVQYEDRKKAEKAEQQRLHLEMSRNAKDRFSVVENSRIEVLIAAIGFAIVAVILFIISFCIQKSVIKRR